MNATLLIDAIIFGNLLVLLSIGLTLTYITLKIPNFAHGDFATVGMYVTYYFLVFHKISPYFTLPFAFLVSGTIALLSYLLVFRPLNNRGMSIVGLMVASIAIEVVLRSTLHIYADSLTNIYKVISRGFIFRDFGIKISKTLYIPGLFIVSSILALALVILLYILLTKTKFGIAMRAAIENPDLAEVLGVNVDKVYAISWFLAGGLAGLAGALVPFRISADPEIGWMLLLRVFSSSILGGLSSIYGAMLGGYVVGFAEVLGIQVLSNPPFNLSTAYRPAIPFAILIATLLLMPEGLASKIKIEKIAAKIRGARRQWS